MTNSRPSFPRGICCLLLVLTVVATASAATSRPRQPSNEPFRSFQAIDKDLSVLNARVADLNHRNPGVRARAAHDMRLALRRIAQFSAALSAGYRARHEAFGVKMFGALQQRAAQATRSLNGLERARNRVRAHDQLSRDILGLVLQFQKVSANYGAEHCRPGAWSCCVPKKEPDTERVANACKWSCVARPRSCSGFAGPQTPF